MAKIVLIQVHHRLLPIGSQKAGDVEVIEQAPTGQDTGSIKLDVARIVEELRKEGKSEYWYMVVKVRKTYGGFAYRTMIPKTFFK